MASSVLDENGYSLLHHAAIDGDIENAKILLEQDKADVRQTSHDGNTALSLAIAYGQEQFSNFILPFSNVNTCDNDGDTPLMFAASKRQQDLIPKLISRGANVNAVSKHGSTALWNAVYSMSPGCVFVLLQHNADMEVHCAGTDLFYQDKNRVQKENDSNKLKKHYSEEHSLLWVAIDNYRRGGKEDKRCFISTVSLLLEAGYDVTQEQWMQKGFPDDFRDCIQNSGLEMLLLFHNRNPQRLQSLCRNKIRKAHLDTSRTQCSTVSFYEWVSSLGLGKHLVDYLVLGYVDCDP